MQYFLAKTDPDTYPIGRFAEELNTTWDGVRNPQAVQAIKKMLPGDFVFIYHSMGMAAVVGFAVATSLPRPSPNDVKSWVIDLAFKGLIDPPTTLREIKESGLFSDWSLVRQSRLSTMTAPNSFVEWMSKRYPNLNF